MSAPFYAPRAEVRISGVRLTAELSGHLLSVSCDSNADMADMFTITLLNAGNRLTDSPLFALGKSVEIHMGYGDDLEPMMLGEVASIQPSYPEGGPPTLTVTGYDRSHALRHNHPSRELWKATNDSAIAAEIAALAGLIPVVDPSPYTHEELPQTSSDMAFLKERARANFFDCFVYWDRLYFQFPRPQLEAHVLEWGKSLSSFTPRLSSSGAEGVRVVRGYNRKLAETVVGLATAGDLQLDEVVERLGSDTLDALVSLGRRAIAARGRAREEKAGTAPIQLPQEAFGVAKALLQEVFEGLYEGSGSCIGTPALRARRMVRISGLGRRFSGMYRLKRVTHTIDDSGYRTTFEVTQRAGSALLPLLRKALVDMPPPDSQRPALGLRVAKVTENVDREHLGRVKVSFPTNSDDSESAWARVVTPMAGKDRGLFTLPNRDDEVIVAFEGGSEALPVVLGGVWHAKALPPVDHADGLNNIRVLKTKKHLIELDDTDKKEKVTVRHSSGSTITLRDDGTVAIESKKNIELTATDDINMNAKKVVVTVPTGGVMEVKN